MKKLLLSLTLATACFTTFAQTNTLPTSGSVGIGTTTPVSLFSVGSTSQFQVNTSGAIATATGITTTGLIQSNTSAGGQGLKLYDQSNAAYTYLVPPVIPGYTKRIIIDQPNEQILFENENVDTNYGGGISRGMYGTTDIFSNYPSLGGVTLSTVGVVRLFATVSGNIGIGTSSPTAKLQLVTSSDVNPANIGTTNFDSRHFAIGTTGANASALAFSKNSTAGGSAYITSATIGSSWDPIGFQAGSYNWYLGGSTTPSVVLTTSGNMLLGKTTQTNAAYILDVNGSVRTNAITVNTTGADFVFAPSYKLLTLPELNNFIQKNHHLPEIASAKDMQANGLNLGDNQIKLLQKIEELTLYLIEKDKELNNEKDLNNKQQQQINTQQQVNIQQGNKLDILEKEIEVMKQQMNEVNKKANK